MKTFILISLLLTQSSYAQTILKDIKYASTPQKELFLDLYMSEKVQNPPLLVWVHGGAWSAGSKENPPMELLAYGFAMASIEYRLSGEAPFPAQIHDIKAAIRFLRGNATKYGFDESRIILWGSSAGGHLAALAGVSDGNTLLEGNLGDYTKVSSKVRVILDYFGASNLTTILKQSTPYGLNMRTPALTKLYGKPIEEATEEAELASPVFYVDRTDPPMFICHGDQDPQMPINQSIELFGKRSEERRVGKEC